MNTLLYSQIEEDLRGTVRELLADRSGWSHVLSRVPAYDPALWRALAAEVGCAGLAVPEEHGGAGASWREVAVLAEELGRAVAPVPYLGGAMATAALLAGGETVLLPRIASGEVTAVLAVPLSTPSDAPLPTTVTADGARLTGRVTSVADALAADVLLVPADGTLWTVEAADVARTPVPSLDLTRQLCDISLDAAPAQRVAGDSAAKDWAAGLTTGAALLASEQLGLADWCLTTTLEYVKGRYQFARPVGSFQAVKHRLAQLWVEVTQARAVARYAAGCLADGDPDTPVAVSLAQAHCGPVAVRAAEECVQLHGGIGFTWEHPAHLYLKRAKADAIALGTAAHHRSRLGDLVDLPA